MSNKIADRKFKLAVYFALCDTGLLIGGLIDQSVWFQMGGTVLALYAVGNVAAKFVEDKDE